MKKVFFFATLVSSCHSSDVHIISKDSFSYYQRQRQVELDDMVKALNDVYDRETDLAKHAFDDSITYWHDKYEIAVAGGMNFYVLHDLKKKELIFRKKAADSVYHLASIHAKREQDKVWQMEDRARKDSEIYDLQNRFGRGEITDQQYNEEVHKINSRVDQNPVTEQNALQMSMDYNKRKYEKTLSDEQKMLEAKVDSLSK